MSSYKLQQLVKIVKILHKNSVQWHLVRGIYVLFPLHKQLHAAFNEMFERKTKNPKNIAVGVVHEKLWI